MIEWAVGNLLSRTTQFFRDKGIESPDLDAELLLAHTLGLTRESLLTRRERTLTDLELSSYRERVRQRAGAKPVAYILNRKEFFGLPFYVDESVLVPRPETEHVVESALSWLQSSIQQRASSIRICDLGTGSGCIAAAIAHARPDVRITATELSKGAAKVAARNMADLGLLGRVRLVQRDLFPAESSETFDVIVSNPPYLSLAEYESLPRTIRKFEPKEALTDGGDGLAVYRRILRAAPGRLNPGGRIFLEISPRIAGDLDKLLGGGPLHVTAIHKDLAGLDRVAEIS
ncbi:peptide chain release factor N(5)-glutamine methyltransferase [bacterium]|nr:peptide chain release factor N(5)-glutamine methyltransferase [bacterium]